MATERVILVDTNDQAIGSENKLAAHQRGQLHRAFSVFIFYEVANQLQLLLQQRQQSKYHSGGLWTNTCCSHPRPGEDIIAAGERRLQEEMGLVIPLKKVGEFHYRAEFANGLIENEYDHVLIGMASSTTVVYNDNEVSAIRWTTIANLMEDLSTQPQKFTPWFQQALAIALQALPDVHGTI